MVVSYASRGQVFFCIFFFVCCLCCHRRRRCFYRALSVFQSLSALLYLQPFIRIPVACTISIRHHKAIVSLYTSSVISPSRKNAGQLGFQCRRHRHSGSGCVTVILCVCSRALSVSPVVPLIEFYCICMTKRRGSHLATFTPSHPVIEQRRSARHLFESIHADNRSIYTHAYTLFGTRASERLHCRPSQPSSRAVFLLLLLPLLLLLFLQHAFAPTSPRNQQRVGAGVGRPGLGSEDTLLLAKKDFGRPALLRCPTSPTAATRTPRQPGDTPSRKTCPSFETVGLACVHLTHQQTTRSVGPRSVLRRRVHWYHRSLVARREPPAPPGGRADTEVGAYSLLPRTRSTSPVRG